MKNIGLISFLLIIFIISFSSCDSDKDSPDDTKKITANNITEAELPKGKLVIEEDMNYTANNNNSNTALGNNTSNNNNTTVVKPVQETRADFLKKRFKNLLVFHVDDTMEVKRPKLATLILSKDESIANVKLQVLDESNATDDNIKTDTSMDFGSKMKAKLVPFGGNKIDDNFEIEALGDGIQSFKTDRKKIIWQWKVTPLKPGQQELKLSVQIIEKDGEAVSLPARNIPVIIFAKNESFFSKAGDFFTDKYEWIIGLIVTIIVAYIGGRARNRNYNQPPPPNNKKTKIK